MLGAMTELRPYQPKHAAPLTGGARFIRGFTRVGAVLAVLITLIGLPASAIGAKSSYDDAVKTHQGAQCIAQLARSGYTFKKKEYSNYFDYDVGGCYATYALMYNSFPEVLAIANTPAPSFLTSEGPSSLGIGLMITGILAVAAYLIFWCIGWLCAGFTRDA